MESSCGISCPWLVVSDNGSPGYRRQGKLHHLMCNVLEKLTSKRIGTPLNATIVLTTTVSPHPMRYIQYWKQLLTPLASRALWRSMPRLATTGAIARYPIFRYHVLLPRRLHREGYRPDCARPRWNYRHPLWSSLAVDHVVGCAASSTGQDGRYRRIAEVLRGVGQECIRWEKMVEWHDSGLSGGCRFRQESRSRLTKEIGQCR